MAFLVNGICQAIRVATGWSKVVNDIHTCATQHNGTSSRILHIALTVLHGISCTLNTCAAVGSFMKVSDKILATVKKIEETTNFVKFPLMVTKSTDDLLRRRISFLEFCQSGVVIPIADYLRSHYEYNQHYYNHLLTLSPDELTRISVPNFDSFGRTFGFAIATRDYCYERIGSAEANLPIVSCVEIAAKAGTKNIIAIMAIYQRFVNRDQIEELPVNRNFAAQVAQLGQTGINPLAVSLAQLTFIPGELHNDRVFFSYKCAITGMPIRDPVGDPNGTTIYERAAILRWLQNHSTSPTTGKPLTVQELVEKPALKAVIDARLAFHDEQIQKAIQAGLVVPAGTNFANSAANEIILFSNH